VVIGETLLNEVPHKILTHCVYVYSQLFWRNVTELVLSFYVRQGL
jgi:hypothetical protein